MATKRKQTKNQATARTKRARRQVPKGKAILYTFVGKANKAFLEREADKSPVYKGNVSAYLDSIISRKRGVTPATTGFRVSHTR